MYFTLGKTRYVGNIIKKKLLLPSYGYKLLLSEVKKVKQDIIEESIIISIYNNNKEIIADTNVIVEYKDGYKEKILYEIAKEKF